VIAISERTGLSEEFIRNSDIGDIERKLGIKEHPNLNISPM